MKKHIFSNLLWHPRENIFSQANLKKWDSDLPMNLWLDDNGSYENTSHGNRVKFQINHSNKNSPNKIDYASIALDGTLIEKTYFRKRSELSDKEVFMAINFTKNNQYALDKLGKQKISFKEFTSVMISGGDVATQNEIDEQKTKVDEIIANHSF